MTAWGQIAWCAASLWGGGLVFAAPFFMLTVRTSQKEGQKASLTRYVRVALICYVGVLALLLWNQNDASRKMMLSLTTLTDPEILELQAAGIGTVGLAVLNKAINIKLGAILFSTNLYTIAFILFFGVGYGAYYATADMPIPMVAWALTLLAMRGYELDGKRVKEIQAVNAVRKDAIANGMSLEEAMQKWQTMDQVPAEYKN